MPALWDHARPGIYVDDADPTFFAACCADLNRLNSREIGKLLLDLISKRARGIGTKVGKYVYIRYTNSLGSVAQNSYGFGTEVRQDAPPGSNFRLPAGGDSSLVRYGHDLETTYTAAIGVSTPAYVALGHELIHALHVISGDVVKAYDWSTDGAIIEEARTVGLGPYKNKRITENAIRKDWNLPRRTYYGTPGDTDGLVSVTGVT